jgi:hypothetical protein
MNSLIMLSPDSDKIPAADYEKLKSCKSFPARGSCNYGSNDEYSWDRCIYMKFIITDSPFYHYKWVCVEKDV